MVFIEEKTDWVAFDEQDDTGSCGFEAVVRKNSDSVKILPHRSQSERAHRTIDSPSVTSWMKRPINSDSSWAPVAPPEAREPPSANKRRPPRNPSYASPRHRPNPISSSSDSSVSSSSHARGRMSRDVPSRRGRSTSKTRGGPSTPPPTRTRSTSRARSTSGRGRSNSVSRRSSGTGRSNSRPPPTSASNHRSRSTSRTPPARTRSSSRAGSVTRPPPSTARTRREMRSTISSSASVGPGVPRRANSSASFDDNASFQSFDINIGRDISFGRTKSGRSVSRSGSFSAGSKPSGLKEKLFGDEVSEEAKQGYLPRPEPSPTSASHAGSIMSFNQPERTHSRILLTATVYHNTATNLWIATINTNQKGVSKNPATASKYLKAFSFGSEKEARESAIANAPPKMLSFADNPTCFICNGKFAMFRRASHCRNCGVCVCNSCSTTWSSKNIPETYNLKKESHVKICKSCNFLTGAFKKALLDGDYEEAIALYGSGNVNLRTPFPQSTKKKEELVYPIHCAVEGGNLDIVRWLMEDHFCPIKLVRSGSTKKQKRAGAELIPTSKDRTVLTIAVTSLHVDILRYLVVDCNVSIYESKDLKSSLRALEAVLLVLPANSGALRGDSAFHRWDDTSFDEGMSIASSLGADQTQQGDASSVVSKRKGEACIICYDNGIDCVMTPCGHQVCCLKCSTNLSACPVCNVKGEFIKIFKP